MIEEFLKRIAKILDRKAIPYMIIGGQAVLIHGRPRLTQDVDVTLGIDVDQFEVLSASCHALGLKPLPADPRRFVVETKVFPTEDPRTKLRVDFIFSNTRYERQAIERAATIRIVGYPVRFASPEDLIIHKIFAGRAIDLEDARVVLLRQGQKLNRPYIRKWLRAFGNVAEGGRSLLIVWNRLCKEAKA